MLERRHFLSPAGVLRLAGEQAFLSLLAQGLPFSFLPFLLALVGQQRTRRLAAATMLLFQLLPGGILLLALGLYPSPLAS